MAYIPQNLNLEDSKSAQPIVGPRLPPELDDPHHKISHLCSTITEKKDEEEFGPWD